MKYFKIWSTVIGLSCAIEIALAQVDPQIQKYRDEPQGSVQNRKIGIMDGNRIQTIFINDGEVGHWPDEPSAEWPKKSGHSYLDGSALLIAAKIVAPGNGQIITPLISAYREGVSADPLTNFQWVLQPVPGYDNPLSTTPAMSADPSSWPSTWPDALNLPADWNGQWYSYFGKGVQQDLNETFFVMDDSKDKKWTRPPFDYFPIIEDSMRAGLGLRVEVRGLQWSNPLGEDALFWYYRLINISDFDYDTTCVGLYVDPGVGGTSNPGNSCTIDRQLKMVYSWCPTCGQGTPSATNYQSGYIGFALLSTPQNVGLTALTVRILDNAHGPTGLWIENDEVMWNAMNNGFRDTVVQNSNISVVMGSGPFAFQKWRTNTVTSAFLFASDLDTLQINKLNAQKLYDSLMHKIDNPTIVQIKDHMPSNYFLEDAYPNPFNPSTRITFQIPKESWVTLKIYDILGREVTTLIDGITSSGTHTVVFDSRNNTNGNISSGVYIYRFQAGDYSATKKIVLLK